MIQKIHSKSSRDQIRRTSHVPQIILYNQLKDEKFKKVVIEDLLYEFQPTKLQPTPR